MHLFSHDCAQVHTWQPARPQIVPADLPFEMLTERKAQLACWAHELVDGRRRGLGTSVDDARKR